MIRPELASLLRCPVDGSLLQPEGRFLVSGPGRRYPVVDGVPVLLPAGISETIGYAVKSLKAAESATPDDPWLLDTVGISDAEREGVRQLARRGGTGIDPVVSYLVAATGGKAYKHLIGKLEEYPIPEFRLPASSGDLLLDLGCNWGRWCLAAARKGFRSVGIDPQLGAVLAGKRVAASLGLNCHFVCADARFLPFAPESFDLIFSYSVLQHLSRENVEAALRQAARVTKPGGEAFIQMPNRLGLLPLARQLQRGFRPARGFEVRYWSLRDLRAAFQRAFGKASFEVDCFFGIGLQAADGKFMGRTGKCAVRASEGLRHLSSVLPFVTRFADSVYVRAVRN